MAEFPTPLNLQTQTLAVRFPCACRTLAMHYCVRIRTPPRAWVLGPCHRSVSTTTIQRFTLTSSLPADSPIDVRSPSALEGTRPDHFCIYPGILSHDDQKTLMECALGKLDASRGVSRTAKKRRRSLLAGQIDDGPSFLPDDCYDFEEVFKGVSR